MRIAVQIPVTTCRTLVAAISSFRIILPATTPEVLAFPARYCFFCCHSYAAYRYLLICYSWLMYAFVQAQKLPSLREFPCYATLRINDRPICGHMACVACSRIQPCGACERTFGCNAIEPSICEIISPISKSNSHKVQATTAFKHG